MATPELEGPGGDELEQGLFSHLMELRTRLLRAIVTVLVVLGALVPFANRLLYTELAAPLVSRLPQGAHLIATEVASPFVTPLKLAFYAALFISMPMIVYQLWAFVAPVCTATRSASHGPCWWRRCSCSTSVVRSLISWCCRRPSASSRR